MSIIPRTCHRSIDPIVEHPCTFSIYHFYSYADPLSSILSVTKVRVLELSRWHRRSVTTEGTIGTVEAGVSRVASSMCLHAASKYHFHHTPLCSKRIVHGCARRSARVASLPLMFPARTWVPRISVPLALLHADRTATRNELVRGTQHQIGLDRKYAPRLVERVAPITGAWLAVPSRFDHPVRSLPRVPHR